MLEPGELERRASDADRDRVAGVLRDHFAQGRLTLDEHEERLKLVYGAKTIGDLEVLTRDLPSSPPARRRPPVRRHMTGAQKGFAIHFAVYAILIAFFVVLWLITSPFGYFWPIWPALGWGVGVAVHGAVTAIAGGARVEPQAQPRRVAPPSPADPASSGGRHWVAVMFTDISNSTSLTHALGDEEWSRLRARHRAMLREEFSRHDGREVSSQGDGFLARFWSPRKAVRCAADIQRRLEQQRDEGAVVPKVRIGIHAGEAVAEDDGDVVGHVVNVASRVTAAAEPGEILVTEPVSDHAPDAQFEDRGLQTLRGVSAPRHLLAVVWR